MTDRSDRARRVLHGAAALLCAGIAVSAAGAPGPGSFACVAALAGLVGALHALGRAGPET